MTLLSLLRRALGLGGPPEAPVSPGPAAPVTAGRFALRLFEAASGPHTFVLSPASVSFALGLLLEGARGRTAEEIASLLGEGRGPLRERLSRWNEAAPGRTLIARNGLFAAASLRLVPGIAERVAAAHAVVEALDFAGAPGPSRARINTWVSEATRGRIPEILGRDAVSASTRLILANVLYLKAEWAVPFDGALTLPAPFTLASGERVTVPTMHQRAEHGIHSSRDVELIEIAYRGGDFAMAFLLPPEGAPLAELERRLSPEALADWLGGAKREMVALSLPRFTVDAGAVSLRAPLATLGLTSVFDAAAADLGGFSAEPVALDDIVHRTFIEVNELGTEAAAATAAIAEQSSPGKKVRRFAVDRPFLFVLRDLRDGSVMFMGRVEAPAVRRS